MDFRVCDEKPANRGGCCYREGCMAASGIHAQVGFLGILRKLARRHEGREMPATLPQKPKPGTKPKPKTKQKPKPRRTNAESSALLASAKGHANASYPINAILDQLNAIYTDHPMDALCEGNPFRVLVACIMSLRTKDDLTIPLAAKLFETLGDTPEQLVKLTLPQMEQAIYPVGFYKTKAKNILAICQRLIDEFNGQVPADLDTLLTFNGVGRKTANLVLGLGFRIPAVCVDVHVHRIAQRLGWLVDTADPEDTEMLIRAHLPERYWHIVNRVFVRHGQLCCKPVKPNCQACPVLSQCGRHSV